MSHVETNDPDIIVIGAGIAGAITAHALVERGLKVTILEAGPRINRADALAKQRRIWEQDHSELYPITDLAPRVRPSHDTGDYFDNVGPVRVGGSYLRGVGGTTWHWQAVSPRFVPADFETNTRYGVGIDWPLSYAELEPHYIRAEREMGVAGQGDFGAPRQDPYPLPAVSGSYADLEISKRLAEHGIHFEPRPAARNSKAYDGRPACHGYHNCSNVCPIGAQYGAFVHIEKAEALGAQVLEDCLATRLDSDAYGQITAVSYRRPDGATGRLKARAYVIAANPLETVRLCLASASEERPAGIANSSGMVGRRLMNHHSVMSRMNLPFNVYPGRGPLTGYGCAQDRDGEFRKVHAPNYLFIANPDLMSAVASRALQAHPHDAAQIDAMIRDISARRIEISASVEQLPDATNRVWLDHSRTDSSGLPRIQVYFDLDDYAKRGADMARNRIERIISLLGAEDVTFFEGYSAVHLAGVMMMGHNKTQFVTDAYGRCHDHPNLFVGGASLFPANSTANPTLTIAAMAYRTEAAIADQLIQ